MHIDRIVSMTPVELSLLLATMMHKGKQRLRGSNLFEKFAEIRKSGQAHGRNVGSLNIRRYYEDPRDK